MTSCVDQIPLVGVWDQCGNTRGWDKHRREGEAPCAACSLARRQYQRDIRERHRRGEMKDSAHSRAARSRRPKCGTKNGYLAHKSRGERACDDCKRAHADHMAEYRARVGRDREREAAYDRARYRRRVSRPEGKRAQRLNEKARRAREAGALVPGVRVTADGVVGRFLVWGNRCWMCGGDGAPEGLTLDHVKPLSAGGKHLLANLRPACRSCNSRKGARWYGVEKLDEKACA